MANSNYSKLVERFLDGEMSKTEVADFDHLRSQDPLLSNEYNSQQEIINGVKNFRKAELKTRFNSIDVTPGLFQAAAGSTAAQVTSVVLLTSVVFVGSYLWVKWPKRIESIDLSVASKTTDLSESSFNQNIKNELPLIELPNYDASNKTDEIETIEIEEEMEETETVTPIGPDIISPELADSGFDEKILPEVEEGVVLDSDVKSKASQVEIENISTSKKNFQYKFYNNKLFLYGDFNGIPYEVLEINSRFGKKLFLYHNSSFYRIDDNVTKSSPLRVVSNPDLIKELMILKENKSE